MFYRPQAYILCVQALMMVVFCGINISIPEEGNFVSAEHPTSSSVKLLTKHNQKFIESSPDFRSDQRPDLFVVLHRASNIWAVTNPPTFGLKEGDYVMTAPIEAVNGNQTYAIAGSINLKDFQSVAIWSRQFNATFGTVSLAP